MPTPPPPRPSPSSTLSTSNKSNDRNGTFSSSSAPKAQQPSTEQAPAKDKDEDEDEEDDYLTMALPSDPSTMTTKKETLTQIRKRKLLHAETAGRPKSKAELAAEAARRREEALGTNLLSTPTEMEMNGIGGGSNNKGLKMMKALGYVPGKGLGKTGEDGGLLEPIGLSMKEDRSGIGRESEAKRKFREEAEKAVQGEKKRKIEAGEFVERVRMEREERRNEGLVIGAQKVAERLEEEDDNLDEQARRTRQLKAVPLLWRGLVRQREIDQRDKRMRNALYTSLSSSSSHPLPTTDTEHDADDSDPEEDADDKLALGRKPDLVEIDDEDLDAEDEELDEFQALPPAEQLEKIVGFLREKWNYCFWCKHRYEDGDMEGCPGLTEDEHG